MNIDEKIKQALENEPSQYEDLIKDNEGLFERISASFSGGMKRWVFFIYFIAVCVGGAMLWSGYQFFTATNQDTLLFWGICFLITLNMQSFIKQWIFMESNRNSIMREVKRVEVAVAKLSAKMK